MDELKKRFQERDKKLDAGTTQYNLGKGKLWMMAAIITGMIIVSWWLYHAMQPAQANENIMAQDSLRVQDNVPYVISDTTVTNSPITEKEETTKPIKEKADNKNKANEIFADNFDPYMDESMDVAMRASDEGLSMLEKFQSHYSFAEFPEVIVAYKQLSDAQQKNDNIRFMYANALMATGKTKEAIPVLSEIMTNGKSNYTTETKFYLALAHVKNENYSQAKKLLNEYVTSSNSLLKERARQIVLALDK